MNEQNNNGQKPTANEAGREKTDRDRSVNYNEMNLNELKELAEENQVVPEGNKSSKETWIKALQNADREMQETVDRKSVKLESQNNTKDRSGSLEAQETLFDEVIREIDRRGINIDNLSLTFDGQEAFSHRNNNVSNQLSDRQMETLQDALKDPQSFQGSVTIKSGNKVLLKIENGQVQRDTIGLTDKTTKIEVESDTKALYDKYSKNVRSKGLSKTREVAENAISDGVSATQTKKIIEREDRGYKNLAESKDSEVANRQLNNIVNGALAQEMLKNQKPEPERDRDREQKQEESLVR